MSRVLLFGLWVAHVMAVVPWGSSAGLEKRDEPFVPKRVDIPLNFDHLRRYVTPVSMATGEGQQHFNFTMTTGTGLTYVAGAQCRNCTSVARYNQAQSTTAKQLSGFTSATLFGESISASIIKETCQLKTISGSAWTYPNQTIVVMRQTSQGQVTGDADIGLDSSGIIGLGSNRLPTPSVSGSPSVYNATFEDSLFGEWLYLHPTADKFTFGMQLGKPSATLRNSTHEDQASDAGVLHWLQPDDTAYDTSKVAWVNVSTSLSQMAPTTGPNTTADAGDWYVGIDGWVMNVGNNHLSNSKTLVATVDPLYTDMYLPADQARLIHSAIPGASQQSRPGSLGSLSQAWTIPCNSEFSFGIIVGSQTFIMNQDILVLSGGDGVCYSAIEGWTDENQSTYLFGSRFISTIYLIFSIPRDGSNSMGFAPRSYPQAKSNVSAIVGGTIGGVGGLFIIAFAAFFYFWRRRSQPERVTSAQQDHAMELDKGEHRLNGSIDPFLLPTSGTTQYAPMSTLSSSTGGPSPLGSPIISTAHPMLTEDYSRDVAPPSYEFTESSRQGTPATPGFPNEKAALRAAHLSGSSMASHGGDGGGSTSRGPVPGSSAAATGSTTAYD